MLYRFPMSFAFPYRNWLFSRNTWWEKGEIRSYVCIMGITREKEREVTKDDFPLIFGFPPLKKGAFEQQAVQNRLTRLAETFSYQTAKEAELKGRKSQGSKSISAMQSEVAKAEADVANAKTAFWTAHMVAKQNGFEVRLSHTDYLPKA